MMAHETIINLYNCIFFASDTHFVILTTCTLFDITSRAYIKNRYVLDFLAEWVLYAAVEKPTSGQKHFFEDHIKPTHCERCFFRLY